MEYGIPVGEHQTKRYNEISVVAGNQPITKCTPLSFMGVEKIIYDVNIKDEVRGAAKTGHKTISKRFNKENYDAIAEVNKYYRNDKGVILRIYNYLATTKLDSMAVSKLLNSCKEYYTTHKDELKKCGCNSHLQLFCENLNAMSSQNVRDYLTGWSFRNVEPEFGADEVYANLSFDKPALFVTKPLNNYVKFEKFLSDNHKKFSDSLWTLTNEYKKELQGLVKDISDGKNVKERIDSLAVRYPEFESVKQVNDRDKMDNDYVVMMLKTLRSNCSVDERANTYKNSYRNTNFCSWGCKNPNVPEKIREHDHALKEELSNTESEKLL